jgi:hypothetical protein
MPASAVILTRVMLYDPFIEGTWVKVPQEGIAAACDAQAHVGKRTSSKLTTTLISSADMSQDRAAAADGATADGYGDGDGGDNKQQHVKHQQQQQQAAGEWRLRKPVSTFQRLLAVEAIFIFSALWHQILFFYLTGSFRGSWRWLLFFALQAPLIAAETVVRRLWRQNVRVTVPAVVKVVATNALLAVLADALFMEPLRQHGVVQAMVEEGLGFGKMLGVVQ